MEEFRIKGINALKKVLTKEQNVKIFENCIYNITFENKKDNIELLYYLNIYQTINDILKGNKLPELLSSIKKGNVNFKHESYNDMINEEVEQDNFIIKPFEIEEGVLECKCGSKRVYSYSKQSRSADEPMSTYAQCMSCKSKWVYSG